MSNFSFSHSVFKRLVLQTHKDQALFGKELTVQVNMAAEACNRLLQITVYLFFIHYFMLSGGISRNFSKNIFQSYTGITSENTDFHVLVA